MRKFVRRPICAAEFEALRRVGAFDDIVHSPRLQSLAQFLPGIAAIGEDMAQPRIERAEGGDHARGAIAILSISLA